MVIATCILMVAACDRLEQVGKAPDFTPIDGAIEEQSMRLPMSLSNRHTDSGQDRASLWSGARGSLLGDRRAERQGDILTVVIEIDERAEISNATARARSGSESLNAPSLLGIPQIVDRVLPGGASLANAADLNSTSSSSGNGSVSRNEKLELRVAATIVGVLQNGVLRIQGSQEVRVNFE
ncbi:MAG: flagellar basal body L-ring protein FlgH, partial [Boseongicola sp.]